MNSQKKMWYSFTESFPTPNRDILIAFFPYKMAGKQFLYDLDNPIILQDRLITYELATGKQCCFQSHVCLTTLDSKYESVEFCPSLWAEIGTEYTPILTKPLNYREAQCNILPKKIQRNIAPKNKQPLKTQATLF